MSPSLPWYVRAWLCTLLVCIAAEKNTFKVLRLLPIKLYFVCRWLLTYLASSTYNSVICVGRNVPFESLETSSPNRVQSGAHWIQGTEAHHLAFGELVIKPAQFKMAFCSWVYPVKGWFLLLSSVWEFRVSVPRWRRVSALGKCLHCPGARSYQGIILRFVRCCPAEPNPGQINWENRSHVEHTTNKHCLFSAPHPHG